MPHRALRSFALVLLSALVTPLRAQTPPPPTTATEPFAALAAKEPQEPATGGVRVVVKKPDGSPAADAVVVFSPWRDDHAAQVERAAASTRFPADEPQRFALLAANGTRLRVDEQGATRVPKNGYVFAFAGELAARRFLGESFAEPRCELKLVAPRTIHVEVTTSDGAPAAGVPIAVRDTQKHAASPLHTTGADGKAALRLLTRRPDTAIVQLLIAVKATITAPLPQGAGSVRLQLPKTTVVEATFTGDMLPGDLLVWRLECGEDAAHALGERTGDRSARWPYVEGDAAFTITVESNGLELATGAGTAKTGSEPLALVRQLQEATFAVQLLGPDGEPLRNSPVEFAWKQRNSSITNGGASNREGWVEFAMPAQFLGKGDAALRLSVTDGDRGPARGLGKLTLQAKEKVRTVLEPLRCEAPPLLAGGTFVLRDGSPVPNLELAAYTPNYQRIVTDATGRFAVRGDPGKRPPRLILDRSWCCIEGDPWSFEVPTGTTDAKFVVQRAARIRFGTDRKEALLSMIDYRLEPASGEGAKVDLPVSFDQRELLAPPGHWHFLALHHGEELHRLPDLRCDSGVETHDPRFMAFDWRAFAIHVAIKVLDANGRPTDECTVWLRHRGSGHGMAPTNGIMHLLLPKAGGSVDIQPRDKKFAKVDLGVVTEDQVVVLGGGPPLTVTIRPMPKLPEGCELVLRTDSSDDGVPFDDNGTATIVLPKAGSFTPMVAVRKGHTHYGVDWQLPAVEVLAAEAKVDVDVTAARQKVLELAIRQMQSN